MAYPVYAQYPYSLANSSATSQSSSSYGSPSSSGSSSSYGSPSSSASYGSSSSPAAASMSSYSSSPSAAYGRQYGSVTGSNYASASASQTGAAGQTVYNPQSVAYPPLLSLTSIPTPNGSLFNPFPPAMNVATYGSSTALINALQTLLAQLLGTGHFSLLFYCMSS